MAIVLDEALLAKLQAAEVDINIHVKATLNITPFVARQKVNSLVLDKVGTGAISEKPTLVTTEGRLCWRVPVALVLPHQGWLGQLGAVDVDVQTGEVLADEVLITDLINHAAHLAPSSPS
jgi:hypothetical protein